MILTENVAALKPRFDQALIILNIIKEHIDKFPAEVAAAKNGLPTLGVKDGERIQFLHSQYDPRKEAENIIARYAEEIPKYDHVFFYGIGMGYHVEAFMEAYANTPITLYEPQMLFTYHWLSNRSIQSWDLSRIDKLFLQTNDQNIDAYIHSFFESLNGEVLVITHPAYERLFAEETTHFMQKFKEHVSKMRGNIGATFAFEKFWVLNSANNFKHVLQSPNIFDFADQFKGKPALIVAAGPSLEEELERIKEISDNGQAFIFAVGSANKALLSRGIIPDALCTYDPYVLNKFVYEELNEQGIDTIPLIFGSSVYYEVPEQYVGPKLHMITTQDSVAKYYLQKEPIFKEKQFISDAPSIAIVTLELLIKMGCSPIVLVGQNMSIRNNQFYSKGIEYKTRSNTMAEEEQKQYIWVESVDGVQIPTMRNFNMMRQQMEVLLNVYKDAHVINTTQGGAKIEGAPFQALSEAMKELKPMAIENKQWFTPNLPSRYNKAEVMTYVSHMEKELRAIKRLFQEAIDILKRFDGIVRHGNGSAAYALFPKWDKLIGKILSNAYHEVFIQPMNRVHFDLLVKAAPQVKECQDPVQKSRILLDTFGKYLYECMSHMEFAELFSKEVAKVADLETTELQSN